MEKKSESNDESEQITECMKNEVRIKLLEDRIVALEEAFE